MLLHAMQLHQTTPLTRALADATESDIELAFAIGVNVTTIWRWKTGKSTPASQATRERIAYVLGREVEELWPVEHEQEAA
ncbi:MAG TPA: helix-turn-helix transcriptional regulator [Conexibacter sp.]|jgi:hypothetical protein|nr:helix-turn-helix transcriptional regulator [Conexibacter sp.]